MSGTKPFTISKDLVKQAFQLVKENRGAAGVDKQTLADFELNLEDNLYKLWNRMSSGSYFPPPSESSSYTEGNRRGAYSGCAYSDRQSCPDGC